MSLEKPCLGQTTNARITRRSRPPASRAMNRECLAGDEVVDEGRRRRRGLSRTSAANDRAVASPEPAARTAEGTGDSRTGAGDRAVVDRCDGVERIRDRTCEDGGQGDNSRGERRSTEPDAGGHEKHPGGDECGDERDGPETVGERWRGREDARAPEGRDEDREGETDAADDRARPQAPEVHRAGSD